MRALDLMRSFRRTLFGGQPVLAIVVIATAVGTGALQGAGFDGWWALPVLVIVLLGVGLGLRRSRS